MLDRLGIAAELDHLHDIFAADLRPKPEAHGYKKLLDQFAIDPATALMAEDMARNLRPAKALGMTTVWIDNGSERGSHDFEPDYVDVVTDDLGDEHHDCAGEPEQQVVDEVGLDLRDALLERAHRVHVAEEHEREGEHHQRSHDDRPDDPEDRDADAAHTTGDRAQRVADAAPETRIS